MRITTDDLRCAAEWCESYEECDDQDEVAQSVHRVAAWLRAEIITRNTRKVAREHGRPMPEMRRLIAEFEAR